MGKATKPRRINPRSKGGRPRQAGERTKSGRLKHSPNERVMQIRAAFGVDYVGQAFSPIQIAHRNRWLSDEDCRTAVEFASIYAAAGLGRSSISLSAGMEVKPGADTTGDVTAPGFFATLPDREVSQIWDAVFSDDGGHLMDRDERGAAAMRKWKAACSAMTPEQREEVHNVCILDSFPQWIIQRAHGHMTTGWERKRDLLIAGLRAVRARLHPPKVRAPINAPARGQPKADGVAAPSRVIEHTVYVNEEGAPLFEVERTIRRGRG